MNEKIKQKGFIKTPLLIAIISLLITVSVVTTGVVLYKQGKLTPLIASVSQVFQKTEEVEPEIKPEESGMGQEQTLSEEMIQEEYSQIAQELEQAKLQNEEIERARQEAEQEAEKAKTEAKRLKAEQETQKLVEQQRQEELKQEQTEEEKIANIKIIDEGLSQLISETQERADIFSQAKDEADSFISTVRNTMNKYSDSSLIQQSGQQLIDELNNLSFIAGKLLSIENSRIRTISSFLGSGNIPSSNDFLFSKLEYDNYFDQYNISDAKIDSLIEILVSNEKIVLDEKLQEKEEEIQRKEKATQIKEQLITVIQEIDSRLAVLDNQIKEKEAEIENERNRLAPMSIIEARIAQLIPEYNALINQWNSLLNTREKVVTLSYKVDDYFNYGTPFSATDRAFLLSLGISF